MGRPGNKATRKHGQDNFHEKALVQNVQEKLDAAAAMYQELPFLTQKTSNLLAFVL